jgi:hypothetical protein
MLPLRIVVLLLIGVTACGKGRPTKPDPEPEPLPDVGPHDLRALSDFEAIDDPSARSKALFLEVSRVLMHPRCINCHPAGDVPHQGLDLALHDPPVQRGPEDRGVVGMECAGCHQDRNQPMTRVPGAPKWHVAPIEMAWVGRTPAQICAQLKDPARNGGKTLDELLEHNSHDELVAWGWKPGADREPAPGTQEQFGVLFGAWIETGAECPDESDLQEAQP